MPHLLQRLKERKLFQWAVVYLAGAWLFLEALGFVADTFAWPAFVARSAVVLVAVGSLAVLVLAWYHGEKGRQKLSGIELVLLAGILVMAGAAVAVLGRGSQDRSAGEYGASPDTLDEMSLAVLPFANRSELQADEYFTDGMHDEILTRLQKIGALSVRGRTSVMQYRDSPKNLRQIGRELNARYVLEGGVQRAGETVRINLQLVDATKDEQLWAETYDHQLTVENLLNVQSEVALQVADALGAKLMAEEAKGIEVKPTDNIQAYDYYLLGRHYLAQWNLEAVEKAIEYFRRAVEADSTYAQGYAGLAYAHAVQGGFSGVRPDDAWPQARAAAENALTLDGRLAEAHIALALEAMSYRYDWRAAREGFERALSFNPSSVDALVWYGLLEGGIWGRFDEAYTLLQRARRLDPRSRDVMYNLAFLMVWGGKHDAAEKAFEDLVALDSDFYLPREGLAIVFAGQGKYEAAVTVLRTALDLEPNHIVGIGFLGYLYGRLGQRADAVEQLGRLDQLAAGGRYVSPVSRAHVYAGLDARDEAFAWLAKGYDQRTHWLIWLGNEPYAWPSLASDPRFEELLDRMDFPRVQALGENHDGRQ